MPPSQRARRRRHERALVRALEAFRARHSRWYESGFDLYLLRNNGAAALAARDPEKLASAWCDQFGYRDARRRASDERRVLPVAEAFLKLFADAQEVRCHAGRASVAARRGSTDLAMRSRGGVAPSPTGARAGAICRP